MIRVIKKRNPTDSELISKLKVGKYYFEKEIEAKLYRNIVYVVYINNKSKIAEAFYDLDTNHIEFVFTNEYYRRNGIATFLYNYIEKDLKIKLKPSDNLLKNGKAFWKNRLNK